VVLKEVAERLREKQNASKRAAAGAGRKDEDGMDVDEPGGSNKNRKYVSLPPLFFLAFSWSSPPAETADC
jgi:hypothetical protein